MLESAIQDYVYKTVGVRMDMEEASAVYVPVMGVVCT